MKRTFTVLTANSHKLVVESEQVTTNSEEIVALPLAATDIRMSRTKDGAINMQTTGSPLLTKQLSK